MRTLAGLDEVLSAVGDELGVSSWLTISQNDIEAFARVTGDDYWIHTDTERAAQTELGSTIAHGLLTLSLGPRFTYSLVAFEGFGTTLNYGFEKVRYMNPVPAGSRMRMRSRLREVMVSTAGAKVILTQTFELEGQDRPACVADSVLFLRNE